jgi:hypothetical protein
MKPHLGKDTLIETPDEARARVFRMDWIERRLATITAIEQRCSKWTGFTMAVISLDEAIAMLEQEEQARAEMRRAG